MCRHPTLGPYPAPLRARPWAFPLQTSRIVCNRVERRCSESRASVGGHLLMADLIEYEVERWDSAVVVFKAESECAVERFTIDIPHLVVRWRRKTSRRGWIKKMPPVISETSGSRSAFGVAPAVLVEHGAKHSICLSGLGKYEGHLSIFFQQPHQ